MRVWPYNFGMPDNTNSAWISKQMSTNRTLLLVIAGLGLIVLGYSTVSLGGGSSNLMSGFAGAALGGATTLIAVIGSLRSLKSQLAHSERENARQRELQALARIIDEFGRVSQSLESRDFADHTAGRLDRTMDGVLQAATMLKLQLVTPDNSLLYVTNLWQLEISQRGYAYWRLRNGETEPQYEYQTSNALRTIEQMITFITDILAEYGRTADTEKRRSLTRTLAKGVSEAGRQESRWDASTWVDVDYNSPWIWADIPHPPMG